ncbi:adhesion G-protein coupled receptor G7-like [Antedon mediterranea]|uniref:adhesion G-protein coupled receptor G7-like n=1 Tax=Antedon mediterranea TaxID=105859 RepID=UPI003AF876A1
MEVGWEKAIAKYQIETEDSIPWLKTASSQIAIVCTHSPGEHFPIGSTVVQYTATDVGDRSVNCSFTVTIEVDYCIDVTCHHNVSCVNGENTFTCACTPGWDGQYCNEDVQGPIAMYCPTTIISKNEPGLNYSTMVNWKPPLFSDNNGDEHISITSTHQRGNIFYLGTTQVRYDAIDQSGNIGSCTFDVFIDDVEPPKATNCNNSQTVNVKNNRDKARVYWPTPTFSDNSGSVNVQHTATPGSVFKIGLHYVFYNATDNHGHTTTCIINIEVKDLTPPVFTSCPNDIYIPTPSSEDVHPVTWEEPKVTDNDGIAVKTINSTHISGEDFFVWIEQVSYTVEDYSGNKAVCSFMVEIYVGCPAVDDGFYQFPNTRSGKSANSKQTCPVYAKHSGTAMATKVCIGNDEIAHWSNKVIATDCFGNENVDDQLNRLSQIVVTESNVHEISNLLEDLTSGLNTISGNAMDSIADVLENVVLVASASFEVTSSVSGSVRNILRDKVKFDSTSNRPTSSSRIVQSLESQLSSTGDEFTYTSEEIDVYSFIVEKEEFINGLTVQGESRGLFGENKTQSADDVTIRMPAEVGSLLGDDVYLNHIVYQNNKLFASNYEYPQRSLHSTVASLSVVGVDVNGLNEPVVITFKQPKFFWDTSNITNCVYWNFGIGDWADDGCELVNVFEDGSVECHCNHLTNFAVLMDVHVQSVNTQLDTALEIISIIGCIVSIVCLSLTLITLLYFKRLRAKRHHQILINLSISLILLYLTFIVSLYVTNYKWVCTLIAALLHYFVLSSLLWMAAEAVGMYYNLIKVFNSHVSRFILKASMLCWGLPVFVIAVTVAIDKEQYMNDVYCFMVSGPGLYFGLLLIIGIILLFNLIVYALVMKELLFSRIQPAVQKTEHSKTNRTIKRLQNAFAVSVLLGLTWLFGFISMNSTASVVFEVLFCIFNSFQGLIIFIFFCLRNQEVRKTWKAKCLYGSDRYINSSFLNSQKEMMSRKYSTVNQTSMTTSTARCSSIVELDRVNESIKH